MNDMCGLIFREALQEAQTLEQFTTFNDLGHNVVVQLVLEQVNDADDLRMTLAAKDSELILEQLHVDFALAHLLLLHDLDGELRARVSVRAAQDLTESALSKHGTHLVLVTDVAHVFESLEVLHI